MNYLKFMLIATVFVSMTVCSANAAKEMKVITKEEVPKAVLDAFTKSFPNVNITVFEEEILDGQLLYAVAFVQEGKEIDMVYTPDGKVAEFESTVFFNEIPANIKELISAKKIILNEKTFYRLGFLDENKKILLECLYSAEGEWINKGPILEELVPKAILEAFKNTYSNVDVKRYELAIIDDQDVYEIGFEDMGKEINVMYMAEKKIPLRMEEISINKLPDNIKDLIFMEQVLSEGKNYYEMWFRDENFRIIHGFKVSLDGKYIGKI